MSSPSQPSGSPSNGVTLVSASSSNADAATTSVGSTASYGSGFVVAQLLRHLPADEHGVGALAELAENAELVLDLRAARNEDERSLDVGEEAAEHLELLLEQ